MGSQRWPVLSTPWFSGPEATSSDVSSEIGDVKIYGGQTAGLGLKVCFFVLVLFFLVLFLKRFFYCGITYNYKILAILVILSIYVNGIEYIQNVVLSVTAVQLQILFVFSSALIKH